MPIEMFSAEQKQAEYRSSRYGVVPPGVPAEHVAEEAMKVREFAAGGTILVLLFLITGCSPQTTGRAAGGRDGYLLAEEPPGARGVLETKTALEESEDPAQPVDLVLVGRVGGVAGFIWEPDRAAFTVLDSTVADSGHADGPVGHDADNCPFCRANKKKALAATAMVRLVDERGEVPAVNAQTLLGLAEGQTVVVRGQGYIGGLGNLVVDANSLFVRP
jgi:hypothetical protein